MPSTTPMEIVACCELRRVTVPMTIEFSDGTFGLSLGVITTFIEILERKSGEGGGHQTDPIFMPSYKGCTGCTSAVRIYTS